MCKKYLERFFVTPLYYAFKVFKIKQNKILVSNYSGKGYGDIPKSIIDEIYKNSDKKLDIVWIVNDNAKLPKWIRAVRKNSINRIYEQVTAKIWIDNCRKQFYERKRDHQFYIQTWHGGTPIKKIEKSVESNLNEEYVAGAKNDSKMADLILSNSKYMTDIIKTDFWYDGEILECGCPRNDIIFNQDKAAIEKVRNTYNIPSKTKICLYAPTFRVDESLKAYDIDFKQLRQELIKKFDGEWKIMIRLHPNISAKSNELNIDGKDIIDVTGYDDMQELLVATDFMITDYSSCIFDYAITRKPCCIYASDIEEYKKDRDFYMDIFDYPFEIAQNNKELMNIIQNFNERINGQKIDKFFKIIKSKENGKGAETIAKIIMDKMEEK